MSRVEEYIREKGWDFKRSGNEFSVDCPYCDDRKKHFYINPENECFDCKKCGEQGNLYRLKKDMGDMVDVRRYAEARKTYKKPEEGLAAQYHNNMTKTGVDRGYKYLKEERGFTDEIIKKFVLGSTEKSGKKVITIPYYAEDGFTVTGFKYRTIQGKQYFREEGCESTLYNLPNIDKKKPVILCEGELDVVAATQVGFPNCVSGSTGAQGLSADWLDFFNSFKAIYIVYDNDDRGDVGAKKVAEKLGKYRCRRVRLPEKDFNECLIKGVSKETIQRCLDKAETYKQRYVVHASELLNELERYNQDEEKRYGKKTDWRTFDRNFGGIRENEITVLTGDTGIGKTTWGLNLAYRMSLKGMKVLIASTEMNPVMVLRKLFAIHYGMTTGEDMVDMSVGYRYFVKEPFYFINKKGEIPFYQVRDCIEYAHAEFDVDFIMLDHLHFFLEHKTENERFEIERVMAQINDIKLSIPVHVLLVVQPSKLKDEARPVVMNDLRGASAIKQAADNVIILNRKRAEETLGVDVTVPKVRNNAGWEFSYRQRFKRKTELYEE